MRDEAKYLYLLKQDVHNDYDTYDSCVICARTGDSAKLIHPRTTWDRDMPKDWYKTKLDEYGDDENYQFKRCWVDNIDQIEITILGLAKKGIKLGVVCASFNAG